MNWGSITLELAGNENKSGGNKMKAIVLAAGYATRLKPLTDNKAKPLLEIKEKPILSHIIKKLEKLPIDEIFIVTNNKFYADFEEWNNAFSSPLPIKILNDKTNSDEDKKGATGDIEFAIASENLDDDLLIIAGDNLFNFDLLPLYNFFLEKQSNVIALNDINSFERAKSFGIASINSENKITDFQEKPENPKSTLSATAIYIYPKNTIPLILKYMQEGNNPDAPGFLAKWLAQNSELYGFIYEDKWFDIGTLDSLETAKNEFIAEDD